MRPAQYLKKILICTVSVLLIHTSAAAEPNQEQLISAKILIELPRYVHLADHKGILPNLCIDGQNEFYHLVQSLNETQKTYGTIKPYTGDLGTCQFVYAADLKSARKLITAASDHPSITVSNYHNFIDEGGTIGVVNVNGAMSIELNLSAAKDKQATLSPDLIELSGRVIQ